MSGLAVVTGAGARVGRAIALELAAAGHDLLVHVHTNVAGGAETVRLAEGLGRRAAMHVANLAVEAEVDALFAHAEALGGAHVVVHAASVFERTPLSSATGRDFARVLDADLLAPLLVARAAAPQLARAHGALVNVLDIGGAKLAWRGYVAYCAARAGLAAATEVLALELAPDVRVNAVAPGLVLPDARMSAEERTRREARIPLGRAGTPEDVARAVRFLAEAPYVTGQILSVDGGRSLA